MSWRAFGYWCRQGLAGCGLDLELFHTSLILSGPAITWGVFFPWQKAGAQKGKPNLTSAFQAYIHITSMNLLLAQGNPLAKPKIKGWRSTPHPPRDHGKGAQVWHYYKEVTNQTHDLIYPGKVKAQFFRLPKMAHLPFLAVRFYLWPLSICLLLSSPNSMTPPFQKQLLPPRAVLLKALCQAGKLRNPTCIQSMIIY